MSMTRQRIRDEGKRQSRSWSRMLEEASREIDRQTDRQTASHSHYLSVRPTNLAGLCR